MENEEEAQRFLAGYGWQCAGEPHSDQRAVHPLATIIKPPLSPRSVTARPPPPRPRSRQEAPVIRARQSTVQLTRQLDKLAGSFHMNPGGTGVVTAVERDKAELLEKQEERIHKFNALGVFKPHVSIIRARAIYHVELAKRLKSVNVNKRATPRPELKPKKAPLVADLPPPPPGLHNKLDRILNDVTLASPPQNQGFRLTSQRRLTRRGTMRRLTRRKTGLTSQPSKLDLLALERTRALVDKVHERTEEAARRAKEAIVARFRSRVQATEGEALARAEATRLARFEARFVGSGAQEAAGSAQYKQNAPTAEEESALRMEGFGEGLGGLQGEDEEGLHEGLRAGFRSTTEAGTSTSRTVRTESCTEERNGSGKSRARTEDVSGLRNVLTNAENAPRRTVSRQKSGSKGRPKERRASQAGRPAEEGEDAQTADAAADLIERAGKLALKEEEVAALRRVQAKSETGTGTRHSPCYRTRTAQGWAALESSLPSARVAHQAEPDSAGALSQPETVQLPQSDGNDVGDLSNEGSESGDSPATLEYETSQGEEVLNTAEREPNDGSAEQLAAEVSVPERPDMASVAEVLQSRLERVWGVLQTPTSAKVDMVIKYTSRGNTCRLEGALQCWEGAAAAVLAHERAREEWETARSAAFEASQSSSELRMLEEQMQAAQAVIDCARDVNTFIEALKSDFGDELLFCGSSYQTRLQEAMDVEKALESLRRRKAAVEKAVSNG